MKIINVNRNNVNTWISWHSEIDKLHNKINSIYDFIYYNNPPFIIYNSHSRPTDTIVDLAASDLIKPVTVKGIDYNFFLASGLRYRQGFENLSNNDKGILAYEDNDNNIRIIGTNDNTGWFNRNYQLTPITLKWNAPLNELIGITEEHVFVKTDINADIPLQEVDVMTTLTDDNRVKFMVSNTSAHYEGTVITPYVNQDTAFVWNKSLGSYVNFPAGYVCVSNTQPAGEKDNISSVIKQDLHSYLIYPLGSSGFYLWNYFDNQLTSSYYENKLGSFANNSIVNLSSFPLRYINNNYYRGNWSHQEYVLTAYNDDLSIITIGDLSDNIWNGVKLLQPYVTLKTNSSITIHEEVFTDTTFIFDEKIIDQRTIKPIFKAKNMTNNSLERIGIKFL